MFQGAAETHPYTELYIHPRPRLMSEGSSSSRPCFISGVGSYTDPVPDHPERRGWESGTCRQKEAGEKAGALRSISLSVSSLILILSHFPSTAGVFSPRRKIPSVSLSVRQRPESPDVLGFFQVRPPSPLLLPARNRLSSVLPFFLPADRPTSHSWNWRHQNWT